MAELGLAEAEDLMVEVSLDATADAELEAGLLLLLLLLADGALAGCSSASHRMGGLKKAVWGTRRQLESWSAIRSERGILSLHQLLHRLHRARKRLFPAARSEDSIAYGWQHEV